MNVEDLVMVSNVGRCGGEREGEGYVESVDKMGGWSWKQKMRETERERERERHAGILREGDLERAREIATECASGAHMVHSCSRGQVFVHGLSVLRIRLSFRAT